VHKVKSYEKTEYCRNIALITERTGLTLTERTHELTTDHSFTGTVTRFCNSNDGQSVWGDLSFSNCRSSVVIELVDKVIAKLVTIIHLTVRSFN
jgi:hypothetical protein